MADPPSYPSVTAFQMCRDGLVCCSRSRWVLLIYPAVRFSLAASAVWFTCRWWQQSRSSLGSPLSLNRKCGNDFLMISRSGEVVKIQKSSLNQAVKTQRVGAQMNDGDAARTAHEGTNCSLSSFCAVHDLFLWKGKIQPKTPFINVLKKAVFGDVLSIFRVHISLIPTDTTVIFKGLLL